MKIHLDPYEFRNMVMAFTITHEIQGVKYKLRYTAWYIEPFRDHTIYSIKLN